jgi:hypothetical protein
MNEFHKLMAKLGIIDEEKIKVLKYQRMAAVEIVEGSNSLELHE